MSRRRKAKKRIPLPDAKFGHIGISKFKNYIMLNGKKFAADKIVDAAINTLAEKLGVDAVEAFEKAISNIRPLVEVRSRRVGGATYQVPVEVYPSRSEFLASKWIISSAKSRKSEKDMSGKLASELLDAYNGRGEAFKKRENVHKMAESNRAFAHYKW